jgi:hypothetical protein
MCLNMMPVGDDVGIEEKQDIAPSLMCTDVPGPTRAVSFTVGTEQSGISWMHSRKRQRRLGPIVDYHDLKVSLGMALVGQCCEAPVKFGLAVARGDHDAD